MTRPLDDIRVIEFAGLGPAPFAGQLLGDLGADVVIIDRPRRGAVSLEHSVERRGKRSVVLDLKDPEGVALARRLVAGADVLIEGLRPGVMERLGLGPEVCRADHPGLIYGRMTGWGQTGPWAQMAGHDITYIALTGALHAMGEAGRPPSPPLNLVGDFGGGSMMLVMGILSALHARGRSGKGAVIDAAILDGTNALMGMMQSWSAAGRWSEARASNILDGSAPYYRCYATSDARYVAVGAIEAQFLAALLERLGISAEVYGDQHDVAEHPRQTALLEGVFATRTMADWAAHFEGTDACVAPVLTLAEAAEHPQQMARDAFVRAGGMTHPGVVPVFDGAAYAPVTDVARDGADTRGVLQELGLSAEEIDALLAAGTIRCA